MKCILLQNLNHLSYDAMFAKQLTYADISKMFNVAVDLLRLEVKRSAIPILMPHEILFSHRGMISNITVTHRHLRAYAGFITRNSLSFHSLIRILDIAGWIFAK